MKILTIILWVLVVALVCTLIFYSVSFYHKVQVSKVLIKEAVPFQLGIDASGNVAAGANLSNSVLMLGDSTAVGVGASKPQDSLLGLIAAYTDATYAENDAVSGAFTSDLESQIKRARLSHYSLIVIIIGGNDIIRLRSVKSAAANLDAALKDLPKSDKVVVMCAGNVGGSTLFPPIFNDFYTYQNLRYHTAFAAVAAANSATYVNLYRDPKVDEFVQDPKVYLAADGLHPSSAGYLAWFDRMKGAF